MFALLVALFIGVCAGQTLGEERMVLPLSYLQSRNAFMRAQLFLKENVPHETRNITDPRACQHFDFGLIVGVMKQCTIDYRKNKEFRPLLSLYKALPQAWKDYNHFAADPLNRLLAEINEKIKVINSIIDAECQPKDAVDACNRKVDEKIKNGSTFLKNRATLLIQAGNIAKIVNEKQQQLLNTVQKYEAIPFLIQHIRQYESLIQKLAWVFTYLRPQLKPE